MFDSRAVDANLARVGGGGDAQVEGGPWDVVPAVLDAQAVTPALLQILVISLANQNGINQHVYETVENGPNKWKCLIKFIHANMMLKLRSPKLKKADIKGKCFIFLSGPGVYPSVLK